ncbi:MAG TPA: YetF domain-containing protein [Kofleriaceae bacterium]|nr:YetF domain-containing protein [Kofleriaceae bacterium]
MARELFLQIALALAYYGGLVLMMRAAGKRLAGQTTTFDLVVLITLAVVLQTTALREGLASALTFVVVVFIAHFSLAAVCARSPRVRRLVRGAPRPLIRDGRVDHDALAAEHMSYEELLAGLRKLGHPGPQKIALATLEETGHISAVTSGEEEPT